MFEVRKNAIVIDDQPVEVFSRKVEEPDGETFEVCAGTTGLDGLADDSESKAYVSLKCKDLAELFVCMTGNEKTGAGDGIELIALGDGNIAALIESLDFALRTLLDQVSEHSEEEN